MAHVGTRSLFVARLSAVVATSAVVGCMEQYAAAKNTRLRNAATLFVELNRSLSPS
jgi:hypothetical protein